ncbi:hypothetical protein BFJ70_g12580 [Fusarium oxysporum]|nr:hypothetical protein BFJ70_g12580 [Fusarium oxysporum]
MIMTTPVTEITPTLRGLEAEHAEMKDVGSDINTEDGMDMNSDDDMEDDMDMNSDDDMENGIEVATQDDPRELADATGGQSLCVAMFQIPGSESTVLQVKARCTSQSRLEIEAYIIIEGHSKRIIGQASQLLAREADTECFFTATQGSSIGLTLPIPGYLGGVLRAEARWDSRFGLEMTCGISNAAACLEF